MRSVGESGCVPEAGRSSLPDADPKQLAMLGINPPTAYCLPRRSVRPQTWRLDGSKRSQFRCRPVGHRYRQSAWSEDDQCRAPPSEAISWSWTKTARSTRIQAAVGNGRVQLAVDGVAGKSSAVIANMLSAHGTFVVYAYMAGGPVMINPFDLIVKRVIVKGFFMNHPDIERKIQAALRESVPLVAFRSDPEAYRSNLSSVLAGRSGPSCPARRKKALPGSSRKELSQIGPRDRQQDSDGWRKTDMARH